VQNFYIFGFTQNTREWDISNLRICVEISVSRCTGTVNGQAVDGSGLFRNNIPAFLKGLRKILKLVA
jgi:hypothetical protein